MVEGNILIQIMMLILAAGGFYVAKHIRDHKTKHTPLICAKRFDCHAVVHSGYSKIFGVSVESFGMGYYAFIFVISLFLIFMPQAISSFVGPLLALASGGAFLFSLYLLGVQTFVLKKGCSWCMVSALISALIFILVLTQVAIISFF